MIEKKIPVKAGIHTLTAYSAHADQQMLVDWVHAMPGLPKEIIRKFAWSVGKKKRGGHLQWHLE